MEEDAIPSNARNDGDVGAPVNVKIKSLEGGWHMDHCWGIRAIQRSIRNRDL